MAAQAWRVVGIILLLWLVVLVYISTTGFPNCDNSSTENRLQKAFKEIETLKRQNGKLHKAMLEMKETRALMNTMNENSGNQQNQGAMKLKIIKLNDEIKNYKIRLAKKDNELKRSSGENNRHDGTKIPTQEYEKIRRKIENGVKELWFYIKSELTKAKRLISHGAFDVVLEDAGNQQRSIMTDLWNLTQWDGYESWRKNEHKELTAIVQKRIDYVQNPKDCSKAKKIVCNLNKGCGFGCQMHHLTYCFNIAMGLKRTMILQSSGWRYSPSGWDKVFKPISSTCHDTGGAPSRAWGHLDVIKDIQVVNVPIVDSLSPRPAFVPLAIPEDLAPRLIRLHGNPFVWWVGQLIQHLLQPQSELEDVILESTKKLDFKTPIVGVQVRRTDKVGTEAAFHSVDEYMVHVEEYFDLLERRKVVERRRVYLASDDPTVIPEAKQKYPHYEFIGDVEISKSASLNQRYSHISLTGVILDIYFLSRSDYLVCTFSSQVCRVAYEIMQTLHPDASDRFHSLDDIYYFGGQNAHKQIALYGHKPRLQNEIELQPGDVVGIAGNHWDGFSKGINHRTRMSGLYPSYKVEEIIETVKFPKYEDKDSNI